MNPSYNDIEYFIEVAQTKNISRAAERLGVTQPSLSFAMKRLEDVFGESLFTRSRSGVQLTKAGKELLFHGRALLSQWEQLRAEIKKKSESVGGQYTIGCHPSVGLYSLSKFIPDLLNKYPDLELKLHHDLSRKITEAVISHELDFGLVVNPVRHPELVIIELCVDEVKFWIAKELTANERKTVLTTVIWDPALLQAQELLRNLKVKQHSFRRQLPSASLEIVADLTLAGAGIGILPQRVAARVAGSRLICINKQWPTFKDRICLVYRADIQKTKATGVIISAIKTALD
ncbi:MAG: LysR family transcriptional regulator [Oligoflexales bacterium]|nr:LysR family transcriptional regulator [Oligoflexales bacterium]